jgi:hypothetical protein
MPYVALQRPNSLPTSVAATVDRLERQYLREVHVMLRLPIPNYRLTSNCTFSCAQSLMSLISGASTLLYSHRDGSPGKDFKDFLIQFFPWSDEPQPQLPASESAQIIYNVFRNPLAHNLGAHVRRRPTTPLVKVKRLARSNGAGGPTEKTIERLEREPRPNRMSPSVVVRPGDATVLFVEPLYWGTRVMLSRLLFDQTRMAKAETFLATIA